MSLHETTLAIAGYERHEARAFLRAGTVASMVVEVNRDPKKRHKPYSAFDIFPHILPLLSDGKPAPEPPPQDPDEQIAIFKAAAGVAPALSTTKESA